MNKEYAFKKQNSEKLRCKTTAIKQCAINLAQRRRSKQNRDQSKLITLLSKRQLEDSSNIVNGLQLRYFTRPIPVFIRFIWEITNLKKSAYGSTTMFTEIYVQYYNVYRNIQLFRERLSEKVHATISKRIVGGFEFTNFRRNLKK